jgi:hypothetical protein
MKSMTAALLGPWHNSEMAVPAPALTLPREPVNCFQILDILERAMHSARAEWTFLRELRVGTGRRNIDGQRLDAFALNSLPHTGMKRICYEVKVSRSDFLGELKRPLKRRIGLRYSNEFYFVTPPCLLDVAEVPAECGLIEAGYATPEEWKRLLCRHAGYFHLDSESRAFCMITVPAPWRDTPGPTWQLVASMLRNQRREFEEKPPPLPAQQRITFV